VESHEGTKVELGLLEELDLADVDLPCMLATVADRPKQHYPRQKPWSTYVLEGVNALGGLLDLAANNLRDELRDELVEGAAGSLALDDLNHLAADGADLRRLSIGSLLDLVGPALGEGDSKEPEEVMVGGSDSDVGLDEGLPLADE